jgi:hypothetical protein
LLKIPRIGDEGVDMGKKIILLMIFCLLFMSVCFAGSQQAKTDDQYYVTVNQTRIFAKELVIMDGTGKYSGYLKMNGYPEEGKFQIYFQDNSHDNITSMHVTYEDLRGIDLNEYFYFNYQGTEYRMTRGKVNNVFLSYPGTDFELFLRKTFPGAYNDWLEAQAFSNKAQSIVDCYISYKHKTGNCARGIDTIKIDPGGIRN